MTNRNDTVAITVHVPRTALGACEQGPVMVSQRNCELLGLTRRDFLELLRRPDCPVKVAKVGKLRLVDANELRAWITSLAEQVASPQDELDGADRVLAEIGWRGTSR